MERFLEEESFEEAELAISALRDLQDLRSMVAAHKPSSKVDAVIQSAIETNDPVAGTPLSRRAWTTIWSSVERTWSLTTEAGLLESAWQPS